MYQPVYTGSWPLICQDIWTSGASNKGYLKVALGICFALKSWKEYLLLFTYLITLGKDVTFPQITEKQVSD